ncbi:MAG TPA: peptidylprolyl isomerase, partial [Alphaproteobacteria bacterium]|nr:peptidylprolyl isomerase [Alphaproteobacteria bacterium]
DLAAEFSNEKHGRGTVSMARAANPDSANSQFFICFDDASYLDGQYSVFGRVVDGMDFVDNIKKGDKMHNGSVHDPDKMVRVSVAADS